MATAPVRTDPRTTNETTRAKPKPDRILGSCMQAVRNELSGSLIVLDTVEEPHYYRMAAQFIELHKPVGIEEEQLVQKIVDLHWRLNRIAAIENNLFSFRLILNMEPLGETSHNFANAQVHAWREDCAGPNCFEKLGRYEMRLQRSLLKLTEEFRRVRAERLRQSGGIDTFDPAQSAAYRWYRQHYEKASEFAANLREERRRAANSQADETPMDDQLASFRKLLERFPPRPTRPVRNYAAHAS